MPINLRSTYKVSDELARLATVCLFAFVGIGILGIVFFSTNAVLALVFGIAVVVTSFFRPSWSLAFLLLYLPFEPFLLKWVTDEVYVYARYFSEVLVYLLCFVALWQIAISERKWKPSPIDLPFMLFLLVLAASAVINFVDPVDAALGARQTLRFILLFFVTLYISPSKAWMKNLLFALLVVVGVQSVLGYAQFSFGEIIDGFLLPSDVRTFGEIQLTSGTVQFWDPGQRVFGTLGRYDRLGVFMAFILLIGVSMLYEPAMKRYHRAIAILSCFALPVLALTYSRSAWFGFLLGFLFISLWARRDRRVGIAVAASAVAIMLYLSVSGLVVNRLIDVSDQSISERFFESFSMERWRGEYYGLGRLYWVVQTVAVVVPASPVFGHGPGMYGGGAVAALGNTEVYEALGLPFGVYGTDGYIDNSWFSLWGETGTLGFGLYLWMYGALFLMCIHVYRQSEKGFTRALALGVGAAMLAVALNAFLATFLEVRTLAAYLWVFAALVAVLGAREKILKV